MLTINIHSIWLVKETECRPLLGVCLIRVLLGYHHDVRCNLVVRLMIIIGGTNVDGIILVRNQLTPPAPQNPMPRSLAHCLISYFQRQHHLGPMDTLLSEKGAATPFVPANDKSTAERMITILHEVEYLKRLPRSGWAIKNIPNPESVAEHSFRLTIMAFFAPVRQFLLLCVSAETLAGRFESTAAS